MVHAETGCQLYAIFPPVKDSGEAHGGVISEFVEAGDFSPFACALLQAQSDGAADRNAARRLLPLAHGANIPLLLENDIAAAAELGADGVHIGAAESLYQEARNALGEDAIIGVECGSSRHAALTFAEMGANYIAFSDQTALRDEAIDNFEDLIGWWAATLTVPCVAWEVGSVEAARSLAAAGADFAAVNAPLWTHPEGPAAAAGALRAIFETPAVPA